MAPRANWKGYLKLSLVSCAVALFPATTASGRIRFNIVNRETGNRIRNQIVDAQTGDPVEEEDRVKGYKVEDDSYVFVEEEDFERVALESTHTIEIESFIDRNEIDEIYLDESYYIVPGDKVSNEAFAVIREAMQRKNMVGLARVVLYRRERLLMLQPRGKGLVATILRYRNEVRDAEDYFDDIPPVRIAKDMLELADHILESKTAHFEPDKFTDRYEAALAELIEAKRAGRKPPAAPAPREGNVINLIDALRRSVRAETGGTAGRGKARGKPQSSTRKRPAQRRGRMKRAG